MKKNYLLFFFLSLFMAKSYAQPTTNAPTPPTRQPGYVISLLSQGYDQANEGSSYISTMWWQPGWGQSTTAVVGPLPFSGGDSTYSMTNLNYEGIAFDGSYDPLNVSTMDSVHFDVYSANCDTIQFALISLGPTNQNFYPIHVNSGWNSIDIPLSYFSTAGALGTAVNLTAIGQMSFTAYQNSTTANVYVQNFYFYKHYNASAPVLSNFNVPTGLLTTSPAFTLTAPTSTNASGSFSYTSSNTKVATISGSTVTITGAGTTTITATQAASNGFTTASIQATLIIAYPPPLTPAPTPPVRTPGNVISLLSNVYTNIPVATWRWFGGATVEDSLGVAGVPTIGYSNADYVGLGTNSASTALADFSAMTYVHVDIYSPNDTTVSLYMINTVTSPTKQNSVDLKITNHTGWNSFDIPITGYTASANDVDAGANVALGANDFQTISQIMFANNDPSGSAVFYVENLYFYKGQSTWSGSSSSTWSTAANWKENAAPASTNDIVIPYTGITNKPTITAATTLSGVINDSAAITIASGPGNTVTVGGTLILAPTASVTVNSGILALGSSPVLLGSSSTGSASIGANGTLGSITGGTAVTVQRYIGSNGTWRMIGFPLSSSTNISASTLSGFFSSGYNGYTYNEANDNGNYGSTGTVNSGWTAFTSGTTTANNGLLLIGGTPSTPIHFTGTLNTGTQSIPLVYSSGNANKGWNFIANPYASGVNWTNVIAHNTTGLDNAIYRYDPSTSAYASYVNGSSTGNQSNVIENGAAFFVHSSGATSLSVEETDKTTSAPLASMMGIGTQAGTIRTTDGVASTSNTAEMSIIKLALLKEGETNGDEVVVRWGVDPATDAFDGKYDAYDMGRVNGADLSVIGNDGTVYSIFHGSALQSKSVENRVIALGTKNMTEGTYSFNTSLLSSMYDGNEVYLLDHYTGQATLISAGAANYSFQVSSDAASASTSRFTLALNYTAKSAINTNEILLLNNPSPDNQVNIVFNQNYQKVNWQLIDNSGKVLQSGQFSSVTKGSINIATTQNLSSGSYFIKLTGDGKALQTQKWIRQ